jgi:hypothetical protein
VHQMVNSLERCEKSQISLRRPVAWSPHFLTLSKGAEIPIGRQSPLTPTALVLIVGLKNAHKIGHAGSIPIANHSRNLSIGRGLALLPKPH